MAFTCCLADIEPSLVPMFSAVLRDAGAATLATVARLNVTELGKLGPDLLVCDVDRVDVDALELLRRIRFVLPECLIAVYTGLLKRAWSLDCHLAGVNCVLSKESGQIELVDGVHDAMQSGCYTDPRFAVV